MSRAIKRIISRVFLYSILVISFLWFMKIMGRYRWNDYVTVKRGEEFIIYSDTKIDKVEEYYDFIVLYKEYFEKHFFKIKKYKKLNIYMFTKTDNYLAYKERVNAESFYGFYIPKDRLIVFDETTGLGTFLHELTHHFVRFSGKRYPDWFDEGMAAFFEEFVVERQIDNQFMFSFGYFSPSRFQETYISLVLEGASIDKFIGQKKPNQSLGRNFILYIYRNGLLKECIDRLERGKDDKQILQQIFNKPIEEIEKDWVKWVKKNYSNPDVLLIKKSMIMTTEELYEWQDKENVEWDTEKKIFTSRFYSIH